MTELQDTLKKIQAIRLDLVSQAHTGLIICDTKDAFLKAADESFKEFSSKIRKALDSIRVHKPLNWPTSDKALSIYNTAIDSMSQADYSPPSDRGQKIIHLMALYQFLKEEITYPPTTKAMCLDLSFAKLLSDVNREITSETIMLQRELTRIKKSTKIKREKAKEWEKFILAIYEYGDNIAPGTTLSRACKIIINQFEKSKGNKSAKWGEISHDMKNPSGDSVKNLLRKKGVLIRDFEQKGRYWLKKT